MDPKAQTIEGLLRSFGAAAKTLALFPLPHPVTDRAVADFLAKLRQYTAVYGPFAARVARHELWVGTLSFKEGAFGSLASLLYARKVAKFFVMPTVKAEDVVSFLSIVGKDRGQIDAAGGAAHLLWQDGVESIQVVERAFQFRARAEVGSALTVPNVARSRRLSPDERERVIDALRHDPAQAQTLLEELCKTIDAAASPVEAQVEPVFQIVKGLDRLILDEPVEDQEQLYANLAEAQLLLPEPLRGLLMRALFSRARDDDSARVLFKHLPNERVAEVLAAMLSAGAPVAEQIESVFPLAIDPEKTKAVVLALEARLAVSGQPIGGLASAVMARLPAPRAPAPRPPRHVEFDDIQVELGPDETASCLKEAQAMDEPGVVEEVARTLVDVMRSEDDERELNDAGGALEGHLRWLIDHKHFAAVAELLRALRGMTTSGKTGASSTGRSKVAGDLLEAFARGPLLEMLLSTLWEKRHTIIESQLYPCLQVVSPELVGPLIGALGEEQRAGMRALLCDLIVLLCGDRVDEIGRYASDSRWFLARNIANILGRLEDRRVLPHLSRLLHHAEYRVRREAVDALARLGPDEAQTILAGCLDDADPRVRLRVLSSLTTVGVRQALPRIAALLERRDPFNREFEMKRAALEALQCYGTDDALPTLRRLARRRLVVGWRGRELKRLAAVATTTLSGEGTQQVDPIAMALRREAGRL